MNPELAEYLRAMVSTPDSAAVVIDSTFDLSGWADESVCGLVVYGPTVAEAQVQEFLRVLKPGAHVCLVAPDDEMTGHTGACRAEDAGFEVRDCILVPGDASKLHYVPKVSRKEREAGCQHLPARSGAEAVDREEGTAGLRSPRAGAGRTATVVHNHHPTVKPLDLMVRLLQDVPPDALVVDLFMGSGSTPVAAVRTGHDIVGIDLDEEKEYLPIADSRVRYWSNEMRWRHPRKAVVEIKSDHGYEPPRRAASTLFADFLEDDE